MKKTFSLSIGGSIFHVEEDAYEKLDSYLTQVRAHFNGNPDKNEILADIEGRIAEKFNEKNGKIITLADAEEVIETMGTVEQIDGDDAADSEPESQRTSKKLYRDPDNVVVAGVSSGLGHFFGVDPILFRLLFAISIFFGGAGIIAYVILWILVPEAKTPSQKLAMRGTPVTISAMADMIRDKFDEAKVPKRASAFTEMLKNLFAIPMEIIRGFARFIRNVILPTLRILLGMAILLGSFALAVGATTAASFFIFSMSPTFVEGPLLAVMQSGTAQALAGVLYVIAIIPLIILAAVGLGMLMRRHFLTTKIFATLAIIWWIAVPVAAALGTKVGTQGANIVQNDPYYKETTQPVDLEQFTRLVVTSNQSVELVPGTEYKAEMRGRAQDLTEVVFVNEAGTLTISEREEEESSCVFCSDGYVRIILTVPSLQAISAAQSSHVSGDVNVSSLVLSAEDSSSINLDLDGRDITITGEDSSRIYLTGKADSIALDLRNSSRFEGEGIDVNSAVVKIANGSRAYMNAKESLDATALNGSRITYLGEPTIVKRVDVSSRLEDAMGRAENE